VTKWMVFDNLYKDNAMFENPNFPIINI